MDLAESLKFNYVFRGVRPEAMNAIAGLAIVKDFLGGDLLVRQFDRTSDLIVILEGNAVVKTFAGETIAQCGPGSIVGEISLIDEQPRSATVAAVGPVKAALIPANALRGFMESNPEIGQSIALNLAKVLCRRLRSMNVHLDGVPT